MGFVLHEEEVLILTLLHIQKKNVHTSRVTNVYSHPPRLGLMANLGKSLACVKFLFEWF